MDRPDLPLNALRTFEVAARQGSFTRAAIELRVTQAAVSHQIARLEDLLGCPLFLRTPSGLMLTDEAKAVFPVIERSLDDIARALDRIGRHEAEVLNIGVVTAFAAGWLLPRLPAFEAAHPEITLRVSTHNNRVEIAREGLDLAIRFGEGRWPGLEAVPLIAPEMMPHCAPALAPLLQTPADLHGQRLLRSYRADEWPRWFAAADTPCPPLSGPVLDTSVALADLAASGFGVALLPVPLFERAVAEGRLARPFATGIATGRYWLTLPADRVMTPAMRSLLAWLQGA